MMQNAPDQPLLPQAPETGLSLQELVALLWEGRLVMGLSLAGAILVAFVYLWMTAPVYQVQALVQVEEKSAGATALFGDLGAMLEGASPAEAEIEIIKSRMVLGRVVREQKLDLVARPKVLPLIGAPLLRRNSDRPNLQMDFFNVSKRWMGVPFILELGEQNSYTLWLDGDSLLAGQVGSLAVGHVGKDSVKMRVMDVHGEPGQKFVLARKPLLQSVDELLEVLSAKEKEKKSGIIELSLQDHDPEHAALVLSAIAQSYVQQNVDRKSAEAVKTLEFLSAQLPELKAKSEQAESSLNTYRLQVGSIDLNTESQLVLNQGVDLEAKLLILQQQRAELLRLYKQDHSTVKTLDKQIGQLQRERGGVNSQVKKLPKTQQEILRLAQEAKVAAELYNNVLNNVKQLEVVKAGQVGNVRVIDDALPNYVAVSPDKVGTLIFLCLLGASVGAGIVLVRRFWSRGVEDPKILETQLGMPVFAIIPHSIAQLHILELLRKKGPGIKLLSEHAPGDLAIEAVRSLRTTLHFSMHDAPNNVLLLVGPSPSIGKTFVSSNLACILAQTGKKVCLIDGDMRRGRLHDAFDTKRKPGLSDYLSHKSTLEDVLRKSHEPNLTFISTGQLPPNPSELLLSDRTLLLLETLSAQFDLVLIDSPPLLAVADAIVLAKFAGSTLMVLRHGAHRLAEIEQAVARLANADVRVKGCVFNDVVTLAGAGAGYGAKYGYVYQYGYTPQKDSVEKS